MSTILTFVRLVRMRRFAGASLLRSIAWAAALLKQNRASARQQRALHHATNQPGDVA